MLVIGTGWTGLTAAREIADIGFSVLLVQGDEAEGHDRESGSAGRTWPVSDNELREELSGLKQRDGVRLLSGARLAGCSGTIGDYSLRLETREETFQERAGAVVLATETQAVPLLESYGLSGADNAVTLSRLENALASDKGEPNSALPLKPGDHVAFLSGFAQEGDPLSQRRILNCLHALDEQGYRTYFYTRNLKVADEGLEELAKEDRQLGTLIFKLEEWPTIGSDGGRIRHLDPVLEREIELEPALIVVEEKLRPSPANKGLARILNITAGEDGFLQEENIHRLAVYTNKRGVFAVGSARNILPPGQIRSDAANAALALKDEFRSLNQEMSGASASIDEDRCCLCLTCYRLCPHGAIHIEDKPIISSLTCQGCGLCASQCPQEAIRVVDPRWDEIKQTVSENLRAAKEGTPPRIVAYCCRNSAYEAGMAAYAFNRDLPPGLEVVDVPCAGSISHDVILSSLREGADGLLVLGCHSGACKSTHGNDYARYKSDRLRSLLEEVGLSRERIRFRTLADNMDVEFARYTREMEEGLLRLGRNPLA